MGREVVRAGAGAAGDVAVAGWLGAADEAAATGLLSAGDGAAADALVGLLVAGAHPASPIPNPAASTSHASRRLAICAQRARPNNRRTATTMTANPTKLKNPLISPPQSACQNTQPTLT